MTFGQLAFEAYNKSRGGKNHLGKETPPWGELTPEIRDAWETAAQAVVEATRQTILDALMERYKPSKKHG